MTIQISGKQVDVGDALRGKIQDRIADVVDKHFGRPSDGQVTIAREGSGFRADVSLHLASGVRLQAHGEGYEAHAAFEDALQKIEKRLRRYKRRLRDHHSAQRSHKVEQALAYVIQSPDTIDDEPEGDTGEPAPIIIAETRSEVKTLSVSAAVMKMDLAELPALLFRNAATDRLNVVYRRPDGHIGWIDPGVEAAVEAVS